MCHKYHFLEMDKRDVLVFLFFLPFSYLLCGINSLKVVMHVWGVLAI